LDKHKILTQKQFGIRNGYSTSLAIADVYENLLKNLDKGLITCAIFLDFAKAFDSVNREILLDKLEYYGIRGLALQLLKSYLSERTPFVCLNNYCSERLIVKNGVPQGSVLGPLLFLIYINNLQHASSLQIRLFADDTLLFHESKNLGSLQRYVNN